MQAAFLLFIINVTACDSNKGSERGAQSKEQNTSKGYVLSEREMQTLDFILKEDVERLLADGVDHGGHSAIGTYYISWVDATQVALAYDANQVAADQTYFKKTFFLRGNITGINSGLGNEPYITLAGTNMFMSPQLHFATPNIQKIAALQKGFPLHVLCEGAGAIAGVPMFKNCIFFDEYVPVLLENIKSELKDFLGGKLQNQPSPMIPMLAVGVVLFAEAVPDTSSCFLHTANAIGKCSEELEAIPADTMQKHKQAAVEKLRAAGVNIPAPTESLDQNKNQADSPSDSRQHPGGNP